jgi:hypothetical protein
MSENKHKANAKHLNREKATKFDWKDYIAIVVAALETFLLPFVLLLIVVVAISLFVVLLML